MNIQSFSYQDKANVWEIETATYGWLNLLVGVSGVGKTRTLNALLNVSGIANGATGNGIAWNITFLDEQKRNCLWKGEFENLGRDRDISDFFDRNSSEENEERGPDKIKAKLLSEILVVNGHEIIKRTQNDIYFRNKLTLRLSPTESVIRLFKEEEDIAPIFESFRKIVRSKSLQRLGIVEFSKLVSKYNTLDEIQNANLDTFLKLALLNEHEPKVFQEIKEKFIEVFPYIEDVKIATLSPDDLPIQITQCPFFQVKEKNVDRWLLPWELANGMLKSLSLISDMYLLPSGSVVLIDELENSLGVNCIDAVGDLLSIKRELQLVITSHHPYIINTIDMQYWKILTRHGGVIRMREAKDFERLSKKSMHDNFTRLLEIDEIVQGIDA